MKKTVTPKGRYGYLQNQKLYTALRTVLFFLLSISLYVIGLAAAGSNKNLLTIVAILVCLPACKSAVNCIIFLMAKGCSEGLYQTLKDYDSKLDTLYDMYFTSYQKNYPISHMALKGGMLCGITEDPGCDCRAVENHLAQLLVQEGIKSVTVNIFSQEDKYIDRLSRLADMDVDEHKEKEGILQLLYNVSL